MKIILQITFLALVIFFGGKYFGRNTPESALNVRDVSASLGSPEPGDYSGAIRVNLDADPEKEIFIAGYGQGNLLLKRSGHEFRPMAISELTDSGGLTFAVSACDIDRDGRDEIFLLNGSDKTGISVPKLLRYENGHWRDILAEEKDLLRALDAGRAVTCVDRKGDGQYGLAVVSFRGPLLYIEQQNGRMRNIAGDIGFTGTSEGKSILGLPGPRGYTNIFVGNAVENFFFENDGTGMFKDKARAYHLTDTHFETRGASAFDADHDEVPDLVYGNHFGPVRLLRQKRDGTFSDVTPDFMKSSYAVNAAVAADLNLDGEEDLYLNNVNTANETFIRHKGEWFHLSVPMLEEADMSGISTLIGDLNGEEGLELLNTHGLGKKFPLRLYSVKPSGNWTAFAVYNELGGLVRGASVLVRTNRRNHLRTVSTGTGRFAEYSDELFIGLSENESVLSVSVTLPSGRNLFSSGPFREKSVNRIEAPLILRQAQEKN